MSEQSRKLLGEMHWIREGYVLWHWPADMSEESLGFIEEHFAQWLRIRRRIIRERALQTQVEEVAVCEPLVSEEPRR